MNDANSIGQGTQGSGEALAVFGGGCFWCTEAVFQELQGVTSVLPGYTGGDKPNPTYAEVCEGTTGHAEVVEVRFDPNEIDYRELVEIFFATHDPTQLNRQGNDVGTQYRSAIFYVGEGQRKTAQAVIEQLRKDEVFEDPIVTELVPLEKFWQAEDYHRNYFRNNPNQPYCAVVVAPKVSRFRQKYSNRLRP